MKVQRPIFFAFSSFKSGTAVSRATCALPRGFATERAAATLNKHPEMLLTHFIHHFNGYNITRSTDHPRTIELVSGNARIISHREDSQARIEHHDASKVLFLTSKDKGAFKPEQTLECPPYPNAKEVIDINAETDRALLSLAGPDFGERPTEANSPVFRPSVVFKVYDWFFWISLMFDLREMDALDLGGAVGSAVFPGSLFCRSSTGIENYRPLHLRAVATEATLRAQGILKSPVRLMYRDYMSRDFDITPYSLIHLFLPTYGNHEATMKKLLESRKGTLIMAHLFDAILKSGEFEKIQPCTPYGNDRTQMVFVRK